MAELARLANTSRQQIERLEKWPHPDGRKMSKQWAERLAPHLAIDPASLLFAPRRTHAVGYIGAGAEVVPYDDYAIDAGLEEVDIPPGVPEDAVLVIVRGQSMYPRYFEGERLFYLRRGDSPEELVGRECAVRLADGRTFVKILRRGTASGLFNLESWNAPLMEDQVIEWAAPVIARVNRGSR